MFILDNALKARAEQGNPIRVALLGAGFMTQGLTNQIVNSFPSMRVVAVYSRKIKKGLDVFDYSGLKDTVVATTQAELRGCHPCRKTGCDGRRALACPL